MITWLCCIYKFRLARVSIFSSFPYSYIYIAINYLWQKVATYCNRSRSFLLQKTSGSVPAPEGTPRKKRERLNTAGVEQSLPEDKAL